MKMKSMMENRQIAPPCGFEKKNRTIGFKTKSKTKKKTRSRDAQIRRNATSTTSARNAFSANLKFENHSLPSIYPLYSYFYFVKFLAYKIGCIWVAQYIRQIREQKEIVVSSLLSAREICDLYHGDYRRLKN